MISNVSREVQLKVDSISNIAVSYDRRLLSMCVRCLGLTATRDLVVARLTPVGVDAVTLDNLKGF
jgi:hypothetical protein